MKFTPMAVWRTRTWPGPGAGRSTSSYDSTSGPPYTLTILNGNGQTNGVATVTDQNHILYTPNKGYEGSDFLLYQLTHASDDDFVTASDRVASSVLI